MAKTLKELHQEVINQGKLAYEANERAFKLIHPVMESLPQQPPKKVPKKVMTQIEQIDQALKKAHTCYLESEASREAYKQALNELKNNQSFMKDPKNKEGLQELKKIIPKSETFNEGVWNMLRQYEDQLLKIKTQYGLDAQEQVSVEESKEPKKEKKSKQSKCGACVIC